MVGKTLNIIENKTTDQYCSALPLGQNHSHNGTFSKKAGIYKLLVFKILFSILCIGILYVHLTVPNFKRKIEMDSFEGNLNYNLLHTYLYVSYLDALSELNNIELKNQKESYLKRLCVGKSFTNNLCLNMIMQYDELINS